MLLPHSDFEPSKPRDRALDFVCAVRVIASLFIGVFVGIIEILEYAGFSQ